MKTAISIPEATFKRVEHHASRLSMSRSEFFTRAAEQYASSIEAADLTNRIDAALDSIDEDDDGVVFTRRAAAKQFKRTGG